MIDVIDPDFRPKTYFRPTALENFLLSKVKGAVMRKNLMHLFEQGRHSEARALVEGVAFSAQDRKRLEAIHPMFMGGNYLPDTGEGEVEVARISIESTTYDVTCVYARMEDGLIHLRVVDEYGGDTLSEPTEAQVSQPMALQEFGTFFLTAWPLLDVLVMNFEGDRDGAMEFYSVESQFYPDLAAFINDYVIEHFPMPDNDDEEG